MSDLTKAADTFLGTVLAIPCLHASYLRESKPDGPASCLQVERARPWKGQKTRPTQHQDPERMCDSCAAGWHATMAGVYLGGLVRDGVVAS